MVRDYLSDISDISPSPPPRSMRSTRSETLTELESVRLSSINSRSTCITFHSMRQLPSTQDLLNICPSYPAQSVVVGPHQQLWCFLVFPTAWDREKAEKQMDYSKYKAGEVRVDWSKRMVPMAEDNLDRSRQWTCLAVHGISPETNRGYLETAFPGSVSVTIARRGGSAFLQFRERGDAEREFRRAEWVTVGGCRVEVMFGHFLQSQREALGDLRGKIRVKREVKDSERKKNLSQHGGRNSGSGHGDRGWVEQDRKMNRSRSERWRSRPVEKSRSRSSRSRRRVKIVGRRKSRSDDIVLTINNNQKDDRFNNNHAESNMELEAVNEKLREDVFLIRRELEDCKTSLAPVLTSSPYKVEMLTPVGANRSSSIILSPSPTLCRSSPTRPQSKCSKSEQSKHTRMRSKLGDCNSVLTNTSRGDFCPLYRELVTQLVGVGLSGKQAHGRAADIVNVWADTGYKVDQLREVLGRFRGREEQREELCRIVKEKCRRKARKMKIDIVAMVDITIAYLLDTGVKQEDCNNELSVNKPEFLELSRYLEKELASLGMKRMSVEEEIAKVIQVLSELSLSLGQMEAEYIFMMGDSQLGGLAEFHTNLKKKLAGTGFHSKYLSARLAAGLIMEFYQGKEEVRKVVEKNKEVFENVDNSLRTVSDFISKSSPGSALSPQIVESIESFPLGYPHMVVVLAFRLFSICRMSEDECKVLARSMVGVWVNYGFNFMEMRDMYEKEMMGVDKEKDNISLMGMRRLLHCRLRAKIDQGYTKPKCFGFSKLIDLTIFYFENAS